MIVEKKAKDKKFDDVGKKAEEAWEARTMAPPCHLVLPGAPKCCTIFTIWCFSTVHHDIWYFPVHQNVTQYVHVFFYLTKSEDPQTCSTFDWQWYL